MTPTEERKLLENLLAAVDETSPTSKDFWQAFVISAVAFCLLTLIAMWLFQNPHLLDGARIASLIGAAIAGGLIGALGTWHTLCKNGATVRKYIDSTKVQARLAELES